MQAEIYPLHYFMNLPMRRMEFFTDAVIAYDPEGVGKEFMLHVQDRLQHDPCMPPQVKQQRIAYFEKMLRRIAEQDFNGEAILSCPAGSDRQKPFRLKNLNGFFLSPEWSFLLYF